MMKQFAILVLLACALCAVQGRQLKQAQTLAQALTAAQGTRVSALISAVQAAGITIPANAAWTIFAPTNEAFSDDDVREATGLTAAQLLEPANKQALVQLLSYHVVPAGAVRAAELTDGQHLTTLLEGAPALRVDIDEDDGQRQVQIEYRELDRDGGDNDTEEADVVAADIMVGNSIVHVIDEVLIPPTLRRTATATAGKRRLLDDDDDGDDDDDDDDDDDRKRK